MKLLFTSLFALATLSVNAQAPKPVAPTHRQTPILQGLGQFKINKTTTAIIPELCKELNTSLRYANSLLALEELTSDSIGVFSIAYRQQNEPSQEIDQAQACEGAKVYYLPNYEISSLPIRGIYLTFYHDLLIRIELPEPGRFPEAFNIKYGKPSQKYTSKRTTCVFTHTGNKIDYKDESLIESWYNGAITASVFTLKYYDANCQKQVADRLIISDEAKMLQVAKCSAASLAASEAKKTKDARKGLSDL